MSRRPAGRENRIADEYRIALRDLTFNSKPIINNLTFFAQENVAHAAVLSRVLSDHLVNCHPDIKLPALYLIDSICKNIGEPFVGFFANSLPVVFPKALQQLRDERLRRDFVRTLDTWWGVFPEALCRDLQQRAFGASQSAGHRRPLEDHSSAYHYAGRRVDRHAAHASPYSQDPHSSSVLYHHPQSLAQSHPHPHSLPQPPLHPQPYPHPHPHPQPHPHPSHQHHRVAAVPPAPSYIAPSPGVPSNIARILQDLRAAVAVSPEKYNEKYVAEIMYHLEYACASFDPLLFRAADERARLTDKRPLVELIDSLISMPRGVAMAAPPTLVPRSPPVSSPSDSASVPSINIPDVSPLLASLSSLPLNFSIAALSPTSSSSVVRPVYEEIIKPNPSAYNAIYADLPRQCTNCALRFPDTSEGRSKLEAHLDAHFRRNMRLKDKAKKVISRVWLQPEQDWIKNVEAKEVERPAMLFATASTESPAPLPPETTEFKVPAGADHAEKICTVCHEKIHIAWDDDSDDWVYKDAIVADSNELVHASCRGK